MKKNVLTTALAVSMVTALSSMPMDVYAKGEYRVEEQNNKPGSLVATSTSLLGAVVAGPIGLMIGAATGQALSQELKKADEYDVLVENHKDTHQQLAIAKQQLNDLQQDLQREREQQQALRALAMDSLEFQVLFHTGDDVVRNKDLERLDELAGFLQRNPQFSIRLHGYADPRGTDEYNNVLSLHRSKNVSHILEDYGIDLSRIETHFYGADQSQAAKGDLDAYAFERRVSIEVYEPENEVALIK